MKPKINYKFYEKLLKQKYQEHKRAQPLQYSYFEEFRDSLLELLEQAFQDGLNACPYCTEREEARIDSEEGFYTCHEIIDAQYK